MQAKRGGRTALTLDQYFRYSAKTDRFKNRPGNFNYYAFGLFGEVGGLLAMFKKHHRDKLEHNESEFASEEIGDALWYLLRGADRIGITPNQLGRAAIRWLEVHHEKPRSPSLRIVAFSDLDSKTKALRVAIRKAGPTFLRRLARRCGLLVGHSNRDRERATPGLLEQFGALLAMLAMVSRRWGLPLEGVALANVKKIQDRWPGSNPKYVPFFDEAFEPHEQLPRRFKVEFTERERNGMTYVVQRMRDVVIGDPLTDNNDVDDGYRYHDVFHFSYAVHLGWSPVIRALLKVKRKSNSKIDTNQDGARAIITEEGIATWIFNYKDHRKYAKTAEGDLEFDLLKQVRKVVRGFEVEACPLWQWERAILNGMRVFEQLYENKGGVVTVDLGSRTLSYAPHPGERRRRRQSTGSGRSR